MKKTVFLQAEELTDAAAAQQYLEQAFSFPSWYGRNLDALHDCLADISENTEIVIEGAMQMDREKGSYLDQIIRVMDDSADENSCLRIYLKD